MTNTKSEGSKTSERMNVSPKDRFFKRTEKFFQKLLKTGTPTTLVLIIVLLGVPLLSVYFYTGVNERVVALRGTAEMLDNTLSNYEDPRSCVDYWIFQGVNASRLLNMELQSASTFQEVDAESVNEMQEYLYGNVFQSNYFASLACELAENLVDEEIKLEQKGFEAKGTSFKPLLGITYELLNTTQQLEDTFDEIMNATEAAKSGGLQEMNFLRIKGVELTSHYYRAQATIKAALVTLAAGDVSILAPFMLVTILYAVFLLFPWILMSLFFQRKQGDQVMMKEETFDYLRLDKTKGNIQNRAFRDREYLVSLILLTVLSGVLFYFFFYPYATAGFGRLISSGGGVKAFADYLVSDATPITFGFMGAYFYVINMLLRRYFAADLNPKPYTYAVVRLLTVFILSVILQLAASAISESQFIVSVFAFVVGIFPDVGLKWITRTVNGAVRKVRAPEFIDRDPLTKLDGLNIWHEARLLEEKVENVQNLATASLEDLVINTNFYPAQLLDWVDQAILFIHARELWISAFGSVGIRTATDLLANTKNDANQFDPIKAEQLACAINATQILSASDEEKPKDAAMVAAAELYKSVANVSNLASETYELSKRLDESKIETLDSIEALKLRVDEAQTLFGLNKNLENLRKVGKQFAAKDDDLARLARGAIENIEKSSEKLIKASVGAKEVFSKLERKKPESLVDIEKAYKSVDELCELAAGLITQVNSAAKMKKGASADKKTDEEFNEFCLVLEKTLETSKKILGEAQSIREDAKLLDKNNPESLNKLLSLQSMLSNLHEAVCDSGNEVKKAQKGLDALQASRQVLNEARKTLNSSQASINELIELTTDAKDAASTLDIESEPSLAGLSDLKNSIGIIRKKAEEVKDKGQPAARILSAASTQPAMTKDILAAIVNAIDRGPNIQYLINFWDKMREKSNT